MRTYLGAAVIALTMMVTGIARADNYHGYNDGYCDPRLKTYDISYQINCEDLKNHYDICHDVKGDGKDGKNDFCPFVPVCPIDNHCDKGHDHDGCTPPPCPHDPHDPAVVPLPASSEMGGAGLAVLAVIGWIKSRRATLA
ncbi:MAG: hypothetical protein ABSF29_17120 [Tepidisphaeraceae bacterium]